LIVPSLKIGAYWLLPLILAFVALASVVVATWWFSVVLSRELAHTRHVTAVKFELTEFLIALQDAVIGERGFLLTGDRTYLVPLQKAKASLEPSLDRLIAATYAEDEVTPFLARLRVIAREKLALLQRSVELKQAGQDHEAIAILRNGQGKELLAEGRKVADDVKAHVVAQLDKSLAASHKMLRWVQIGAFTAALLVGASAGFAYRAMRRQMATLASTHDALYSANQMLMSEAAERERVADQLRQAQKMEVIGQLTGGIAHDFNNMLAIITGSLNLFKRRYSRGDAEASLGLIDDALEGAGRAATLTRQLLAFSRQQALAPVPLDPNKLIAGMSSLLSRTLGQAIQVEIVFAGGSWRAHVDPNQLENALLNLCINARDAMPQGGRLTIETSNAFLDEAYAAQHPDVECGQYVLIAVTDTGSGMPPEVAAKAFEPFFTTKTVGEGTGLGLSQVFGFVKQSGGHTKIYSEVGEGTTVKLYLPRHLAKEDEPENLDELAADLPQGDPCEVILVVEDEERVRRLTTQSLRELGYTVYHAGSAAAALRILGTHDSVALLFTDIVMPEVDGRQLADEARRRNPQLKVLFTTGFTRNAITHNGALDPHVHLIVKPFNLVQLAAKVRYVLDQPDARARDIRPGQID
jgi:signal transduction histidine kinase/ActR/RegA family two-component response regulator